MLRILSAICLFSTSILASPGSAQEAKAAFINAQGESAGSATLGTAPGGVFIAVEVSGLPAESWVAFHIHENGTCDPSAGHETAGGHFNPTQSQHGYLTEGGPHAGDMPNIWVDAAGVARAQVFNPYVVLTEGENLVRGRALMVHAGADDYKSQPSGGAGDRLTCAVIE